MAWKRSEVLMRERKVEMSLKGLVGRKRAERSEGTAAGPADCLDR